jgi:hypothetical protein
MKTENLKMNNGGENRAWKARFFDTMIVLRTYQGISRLHYVPLEMTALCIARQFEKGMGC